MIKNGATLGLFLAIASPMIGAEDLAEARVTKARLDIRSIETAAKFYAVKNEVFPAKLEDLTAGDRPILEAKALNDPWGYKYRYDPKGPKNKGEKPDIWTETPDKKVIGNWTEEKK